MIYKVLEYRKKLDSDGNVAGVSISTEVSNEKMRVSPVPNVYDLEQAEIDLIVADEALNLRPLITKALAINKAVWDKIYPNDIIADEQTLITINAEVNPEEVEAEADNYR